MLATLEDFKVPRYGPICMTDSCVLNPEEGILSKPNRLVAK